MTRRSSNSRLGLREISALAQLLDGRRKRCQNLVADTVSNAGAQSTSYPCRGQAVQWLISTDSQVCDRARKEHAPALSFVLVLAWNHSWQQRVVPRHGFHWHVTWSGLVWSRPQINCWWSSVEGLLKMRIFKPIFRNTSETLSDGSPISWDGDGSHWWLVVAKRAQSNGALLSFGGLSLLSFSWTLFHVVSFRQEGVGLPCTACQSRVTPLMMGDHEVSLEGSVPAAGECWGSRWAPQSEWWFWPQPKNWRLLASGAPSAVSRMLSGVLRFRAYLRSTCFGETRLYSYESWTNAKFKGWVSRWMLKAVNYFDNNA